jgi:hypothetical protein
MKVKNDRHSYGAGYYDGLAVARMELRLFIGVVEFVEYVRCRSEIKELAQEHEMSDAEWDLYMETFSCLR